MKMKKTKVYGLIVAFVLAFAALNFATLNEATGQSIELIEVGEGNQQFVSTICVISGVDCNNCDSGSNTCTDHTCSQCRPN